MAKRNNYKKKTTQNGVAPNTTGATPSDLLIKVFGNRQTGDFNKRTRIFLAVVGILALLGIGIFYLWPVLLPNLTNKHIVDTDSVKAIQAPDSAAQNVKDSLTKEMEIIPPVELSGSIKHLTFSGQVTETDGITGIDSVWVTFDKEKVLTQNGEYTITIPFIKDHLPQESVIFSKPGYIAHRTLPVEVIWTGEDIYRNLSIHLKRTTDD